MCSFFLCQTYVHTHTQRIKVWYGRAPQGLLLEDRYITRTGVHEGSGEWGLDVATLCTYMHSSRSYAQVKADTSELLSLSGSWKGPISSLLSSFQMKVDRELNSWRQRSNKDLCIYSPSLWKAALIHSVTALYQVSNQALNFVSSVCVCLCRGGRESPTSLRKKPSRKSGSAACAARTWTTPALSAEVNGASIVESIFVPSGPIESEGNKRKHHHARRQDVGCVKYEWLKGSTHTSCDHVTWSM